MAIAPLAGFFALSFGLTWLCWVPAALGAGGATTATGRVLLAAGSAGPLLAALLVLAPQGQRVARARWWRRLTGLGGLASPAGMLCVLLPVLIARLSLDSYAFAGGINLPAAQAGEVITLVFSSLILGALPEELGWRGYALPTLLRGRDPLAPTLLLALAWGAWQLPLFFMKGTYQAGIELGSAIGMLYFVNLAAQSMLMTGFYLATRCTWAAVLFHGLTVLMGEIWQLPVVAEIHRSLWTILLAGVVVLLKPPFGIRERPLSSSWRRGEPP